MYFVEIYRFCTIEERNRGYLSISQIAEKWGISSRGIRILCAEGRIPGVFKMGAYGLFQKMWRNHLTKE